MASYRIYKLNQTGRIVVGVDVLCSNDEAAFVWAASAFGAKTRAEIWQGTRCLGSLPDAVEPQSAEHGSERAGPLPGIV